MSVRSGPLALLMLSLLAAWLGAALLVTAVVAPAAFAVLPTRTMAGALVGRVLPVLFWSGLVVGVSLALAARPIGLGALAISSGAALAAACAVAQLVIAPRIESLRAAIAGPVDALDPTDARRVAFGRLHGFSVLWLAVAGVAALVAFVLVSRILTVRSSA